MTAEGRSFDSFDIRALYDAIDAERRSRDLSWSQVAREMGGLAASTLTGLRTRGSVEGDGVLQMLRWLGRTPESFVPGRRSGTIARTALPRVSASQILRFDTIAMCGAVDAERRSRGLTWQQVADEIGGVTASNLTRLAKGGRIGIAHATRITAWLGCSVADFVKAH